MANGHIWPNCTVSYSAPWVKWIICDSSPSAVWSLQFNLSWLCATIIRQRSKT